MALSYNLGYQESISVHPTRRQIFAGKPYSTLPNIWEWVIRCEGLNNVAPMLVLLLLKRRFALFEHLNKQKQLCVGFFEDLINNFWFQSSLLSNIAKGTTDPRIEFILPKLLLEVILWVLAQSLLKFHLQNLDQETTSKSQPNVNISTKHKLLNLDQT